MQRVLRSTRSAEQKPSAQKPAIQSQIEQGVKKIKENTEAFLCFSLPPDLLVQKSPEISAYFYRALRFLWIAAFNEPHT
jgi:predicted alpha/beta superfamily hydrolase